ncbi:MAG: peptidylprolyl isomerase [Alphaproteobacteria bacterium]|jgi:cyclophilin family peptidyl-prolyl cis-trans isomerase|nr:peptidylprolyl isomerase [Alphaproteobacteria bacterium]
MKRFKMLAAAVLAMVVAGPALAQGGQRPRPPEPVNTVAPIFVAPTIRTASTTPALLPENTWILDLSNGGRVAIQLRPDAAPTHVERIKALTRSGFYNGLTFHRVIEGFMAQGGDPAGNGSGESPLADLTAEFNDLPHLRGTVAMARTEEPNSANSQFYIMFVPRLSMDREYTVFGRVVSGMDVVDRITRGEPPAQPTRIVRASIGSDNVPPPTAAEVAAANTPPPAPAAGTGLTVMNVPSLTGSPTRRQAPAPQSPGTTIPQN